jgi:hypothetical protein
MNKYDKFFSAWMTKCDKFWMTAKHDKFLSAWMTKYDKFLAHG